MELKEINSKQAYEWVKTGYWSLDQFNYWVVDLGSEAYREGYERGEQNEADVMRRIEEHEYEY